MAMEEEQVEEAGVRTTLRRGMEIGLMEVILKQMDLTRLTLHYQIA